MTEGACIALKCVITSLQRALPHPTSSGAPSRREPLAVIAYLVATHIVKLSFRIQRLCSRAFLVEMYARAVEISPIAFFEKCAIMGTETSSEVLYEDRSDCTTDEKV